MKGSELRSLASVASLWHSYAAEAISEVFSASRKLSDGPNCQRADRCGITPLPERKVGRDLPAPVLMSSGRGWLTLEPPTPPYERSGSVRGGLLRIGPVARSQDLDAESAIDPTRRNVGSVFGRDSGACRFTRVELLENHDVRRIETTAAQKPGAVKTIGEAMLPMPSGHMGYAPPAAAMSGA
jgi:hypothetical protein